MGNIRLGCPDKLVLQLRDAFNLATFIETGTYKAGTTIWAAQNFKKVYSVEGFKEYYDKAISKCAEYKNVTLHFGDSRDELPKILKKVKSPALIWLDAHWLGNVEESAGTWGECPIIEELNALERSGAMHFILIDDEHCFKHELPGMAVKENWPDMNWMTARLKGMGYYVTSHEDVIIAVPKSARNLVTRYKSNSGINILVPTSNEYAHCITPFSYLFNKYWSDKQPVTVIRYDVRPPKVADNFYKPSLGNQADYTWSSGIAAFLKDYDSDLFILMLEDYFIHQPVDIEAIKQLWDFMIEHPEIVKIDLSDDRLKYPHEEFWIKTIKSADDAPWQTSLQAAIWRKDYFLRFLDPTENAWQFEKEGTKRVINAREAGEFEGIILGTNDPPIKYINAIGGHGTKPGEYDYHKIPRWMAEELQEKRLI